MARARQGGILSIRVRGKTLYGTRVNPEEVSLTTTIVIADDHAFLRTLLRDRLNTHEDLEVVGLAENGLVAVALCGQHLPDVVLMDLSMPIMDGLQAIPLIREVSPDTRCIVLTMHQSQEILREVLVAGGVGYVVKSSSEETILEAIRRVAGGSSYIDVPVDTHDALSEVVSEPPRRPGHENLGPPDVLLTEDERTLSRMVGLGFTNKEIASELHLSPKTIEARRAKLMAKLGFKKRSELVQYALRSGLLEV